MSNRLYLKSEHSSRRQRRPSLFHIPARNLLKHNKNLQKLLRLHLSIRATARQFPGPRDQANEVRKT